jgi:ATP-dependent protease ClpP protease subunit
MNPLRSQVGAITLTFTLILSIYRTIGIFKRDKELTITIKMLVWGKTKKKPKNDDDDDEENCGSVSVHGNHIYFYADVETKSVQALVQALLKLNKPGNMYREIFVHINSWGGYVMDAFAAIDSIRASATPVVTLIEGMCASAATMISIAGDRRLMRPNAVMLIHQLRGGMYGKKCDVDDEIINLNNLEERIIQLFKNNTKVRVKKFKAMMKRELEYPVDECLKHGFVDEVYKGESVIGKRKRE